MNLVIFKILFKDSKFDTKNDFFLRKIFDFKSKIMSNFSTYVYIDISGKKYLLRTA